MRASTNTKLSEEIFNVGDRDCERNLFRRGYRLHFLLGTRTQRQHLTNSVIPSVLKESSIDNATLRRGNFRVLIPPLVALPVKFSFPPCTVRESLLSAKLFPYRGEVSERFKEHAWKACVGEILPWVRIPPSPPSSLGIFSAKDNSLPDARYCPEFAQIPG